MTEPHCGPEDTRVMDVGDLCVFLCFRAWRGRLVGGPEGGAGADAGRPPPPP